MSVKTKKRGYLVYIPCNTTQPIFREEFKGKAPAYEKLRDAVGGLIQPIKVIYEGKTVNGYANEEGICLGLRVNTRASDMFAAYWRKRSPRSVQYLQGNVVLVIWEKVEDIAPAAVAENPAPNYGCLLSEWLTENTDSHEIYDSAALAEKFAHDTGVAADWPTHTEKQTVTSIKGRGKGGELALNTGKLLAFGYEIAEHYAKKHAGWRPWQNGLGFRWQSALKALVEAGY